MSLRVPDVCFSKIELPVEIGLFNRIQIYNGYLAEPTLRKILQNFAADTSCSYHKYSRFRYLLDCLSAEQ